VRQGEKSRIFPGWDAPGWEIPHFPVLVCARMGNSAFSGAGVRQDGKSRIF